MAEAPSYGTTRKRREEVTYAQIERAATDILKTGVRPTLEGVRSAVGGGSPRTILDGLNRYWRDLGGQVAGQPDTLRRLPAAVADLAEGMWQRALSVAMDTAQTARSEADEKLSRLKNQLELRSHTLSQREVELDELLRSRERTVKELEDHLRAALLMLTKRDTTISGLESRLVAARNEATKYRLGLAQLVRRALTAPRRLAIKPKPKPRKKSRRDSKHSSSNRVASPRQKNRK